LSLSASQTPKKQSRAAMDMPFSSIPPMRVQASSPHSAVIQRVQKGLYL
jgi:hypothetical protein